MNSKLFRRFLLSYFIVLLIPIIINHFTYRMFMDSLKNYSTDSSLKQLEKITEKVNDELSQLNELVSQISNDMVFRRMMFSFTELNTEKYLGFNDCIQSVYNYFNSKELLASTDYYVYFKNYNYIMTADSLYPPQLYYTAVLQNYTANPEGYEIWYAALQSGGAGNAYALDSQQQIGYAEPRSLIYAYTVPLRFDNKVMGTMVIHLNKNVFRNYFEQYISYDQSLYYIEDQNGQKLLSSEDSKPDSVTLQFPADLDFSKSTGTQSVSVNDHKMIAAYIVSPGTGWRYVTLIPEDLLYADLQDVRKLNYLLFALLYFCGLLTALFLTDWNSKPVLNATTDIQDFLGSDSPDAKDPYKALTHGVSKLISDQISLQKDLEGQKPFLQSSYLNNLIFGKMYDEHELYAMAKYLEMDLSGTGFYMAVIRTFNDDQGGEVSEDNIEELFVWKSIVRNTYLRCFGTNIIVHDIDNRRLALIFSLSLDNLTNEDFCRIADSAIGAANHELILNYNMSIFIGMSGYCQTATDLWRGYEQACTALTYAWGNNMIVWYDKIRSLNDHYYYPLEMEQRLLSLCSTGDSEQVGKCMDILYQENFLHRKLSIQMYHEMFIVMHSTIHKLFAKTPRPDLQDLLNKSSSKVGALERFDIIRSVYKALCASTADEKNVNTQQFIRQITKYIEENYTDSGLGLYKIASAFNLSEGYFSSFFKAQMNIKFTDYLEKVRLDRSIELLKTTDYTIDAIAAMVGYNSSQSFRRAFKKVHFISPNSLRSQAL